jgi:transcriptional regulator with XRE-family HTH domain
MFEPASFGARIKALREGLSMTEKDLALACGAPFSPLSIRVLEAGRKEDIGVNQLVALALALGVTPAELLVGSQRLTANMVLVDRAPRLETTRANAYAWFAGLRTVRRIDVRAKGQPVALPERSQVPELIRLLERRAFLLAEIVRHERLADLSGARIHDVVVAGLEEEASEISRLLSAMGLRSPDSKAVVGG